MELIQIQNTQVVNKEDVVVQETDNYSNNKFIEANTQSVSLSHLKQDCIIPVFAKDNETTISHYDFIQSVREVIQQLFPKHTVIEPQIRVSHVIKGRIPSAIGKPVKELLDHEKTIYYERMAFMLEIPEIQTVINNQKISLTIGGVRAFNQENLFSKKSIEKFKVFVGFKNHVCCNLCISTDGLVSEMRVTSVGELEKNVASLIREYNQELHIEHLNNMCKYALTFEQVAHLIGKMKMYPYLTKEEKKLVFNLKLSDSQINAVSRDFFQDKNFSCNQNKGIDLWSFYNLLTGATKSSYIDAHLERNCNAYEFINMLAKSIEIGSENFYYHI